MRKIEIAFRFDDCSARSSADFEERLLGLFETRGVPCTFAVIPFVCGGDWTSVAGETCLPFPQQKAAMLKRFIAGGVLEPALHGYSHQTSVAGPDYAEFSGLPDAEQSRRIRQGRGLLQDLLALPVTTFVPPWNRYDRQTTAVLEREGFETLSAGREGERPPSALRFVPVTAKLNDLEDAVRRAKKSWFGGPRIVTGLHEFDFREVRPSAPRDLAEFDALLLRLASDPAVGFKTVREMGRE